YAREVHIREAPHFLGLPALLAAIRGIVQLDLLVERAVVVDHDDGVDVVAPCGLELGNVIIEPAVAREAHDWPLRGGAFRAERSRKSPAQRAGRAQVRLSGVPELDETRGPDTRMAGIRHHYAVRRQCVRNFLADALGADRCDFP